MPVEAPAATVRDGRGVAASRPVRTAIAAAGAVLGGIGFVDITSRGVDPALAASVLVGYSWVYLAAGAIAWETRPTSRIGGLMVLVGIAAATILASGSSVPALALLPLVGVPVMNGALIWLILSYPTGRLSSPLHIATAAAVGLAVATANVLARVIGPEVVPYGAAVLVVVAVWTMALILRRWIQSSTPARRSLGPMVLAGVLVTVLFAGESLAALAGIPTELGTPFRFAMLGARIAVPIAFVVGLLRMRIARGAVADFVVGLDVVGLDVGGLNRLREPLAQALGDPTLQVAVWSPTDRGYRDADGGKMVIPGPDSGRSTILLERDGEPIGTIIHDPALGEDPGLVSAVSAAVRMAVDNDRLSATVRAQLEDVRASRARIVEAGDAERRRVERNLHDGAQQRLVALALALRRARGQLPADAAPELEATLEGASEQLAGALAELRALARGIHPAILTEAGLAAALRTLARESPVHVTATILLDERLPETVEAAAYFLAAEALANVAKYARADAVRLTAVADAGLLRVEIIDNGVGGADPGAGSGLRGLADRLAAVGGALEIHSPPGKGTRLIAELPLSGGSTS
jgi:signal transduction histidine kinase